MGIVLIVIIAIVFAFWYRSYRKKTSGNIGYEDTLSSKWAGRKKYKLLGIIMLIISMIYALDYIFGHVLFASGGLIKVPNIEDVISILYALLFAVYGFIFIYLYKH